MDIVAGIFPSLIHKRFPKLFYFEIFNSRFYTSNEVLTPEQMLRIHPVVYLHGAARTSILSKKIFRTAHVLRSWNMQTVRRSLKFRPDPQQIPLRQYPTVLRLPAQRSVQLCQRGLELMPNEIQARRIVIKK